MDNPLTIAPSHVDEKSERPLKDKKRGVDEMINSKRSNILRTEVGR